MTDSTEARDSFEFMGPHREALKVIFGALEFEGVVMRFFPLRANLNRLRTFCDRYLNSDIPEEIAHFEPMAPYVLMLVINYGRMADTLSNLGWVAQNEIFFAVPVTGRWNQDGETIREAAVVAPFIFVDNQESIAVGREVYGWPKMPVWLEPGTDSWLRDPRSNRRLLTLKTLAIAELYQDQRAQAQTLLEIEQTAPKISGQIPPDFEYLMQPLLRLPRVVAEALSAAPDFLQSLNKMFQSGAVADLPALVSQVFKGLIGSNPSLYDGNIVTLKQFRSSEPGTICYQSLVNSRMLIKRFNAGGLMGSVDLLRGDPSAGLSIYVHQMPAFPIIESLGIEVEREHQRQGVPVAELKPLLPFWASLDMRYERGRRICWRSYGTKWRAWGVDDPVENALEVSKRVPESPPPFNTTLGPVIAAVEGPFDFYDVSIRVLPLVAGAEELAKLLPDMGSVRLKDDRRLRPPFRLGAAPRSLYKALGARPYVYLVVTTYGEMSSAANDIGWWAKNEVSFVHLVEWGGLPWLVWPYSFSDSNVAVTEGREVLGLPTAFARISKGTDTWLEGSGVGTDRQLLTVSATDFPVAGLGQQAIEQRLIEINRSDEPFGEPGSGLLEAFKKRSFAKYQEHGIRLQNLSLKEFRDEEEPETPCYQGLIGFNRELGELAETGTEDRATSIELEELPGRYTVSFNSTPSWPIAEKLGLAHRTVRPEGGSPIKVCDVVEPFLIRTNIRAHLSKGMAQRQIDSANWYLTAEQKSFFEATKKEVQSDPFNMHAVAQGRRRALLMDLLVDLAKIKGRDLQKEARGKRKVKARTRRAGRETEAQAKTPAESTAKKAARKTVKKRTKRGTTS